MWKFLTLLGMLSSGAGIVDLIFMFFGHTPQDRILPVMLFAIAAFIFGTFFVVSALLALVVEITLKKGIRV